MTIRTDIGRFGIVPEWLLDTKPRLSDKALRLYLVLACRYADRDGVCHPGRELLASDVGCSLDTLDRAKTDLEKAGALVVTRAPAERPGPNVYTLITAVPAREGGSRMGAAPGAAPMRPEPEEIAEAISLPGVSTPGREPPKARPTAQEQAVWDLYRELVQPQARTFPLREIRAALKTWSPDDLKLCMEHAAASVFYSQEARQRGWLSPSWFFKPDRLEKLFNLNPAADNERRANGGEAKPERPGITLLPVSPEHNAYAHAAKKGFSLDPRTA